MTANRRMSCSLNEAFRAALRLTGNMDAAEAAVLDGIAALEQSAICRDTLLEETARCSNQRRGQFRARSDRVSLLPPQLQRLLLLDPIGRDCFVLRVLIGLTPAACFGILRLSKEDFEGALHPALQGLPLVGRYTPARFSRIQSRPLPAARLKASSNSPEFVGPVEAGDKRPPARCSRNIAGADDFSLDTIPTTRYDTD